METETRTVRSILIGLGLLVIVGACFVSGLVVGWFTRQPVQAAVPTDLFASSTPMPGRTEEPSDLDELFQPFWQAWEIVHEQYVDQPVDDVELMRGAIQGMLQALDDPHTSYMDPQEFQQANAPLQGEYEGIGAWVDVSGDYLTIISPMPDSPAEEAGLKPGDRVIAVNGEDMTGVDGNLVLREILGPAGTDVVLTVDRGGRVMDITISREKITVPSVTGEMLEDNIAYIQLLTYGERTRVELRSELRRLLRENPDGLILDLRNNGGGYLDTAIDVVSEFIDEGVVMYEQFGDGREVEYRARGRGLATDIPLVVLVNEGTASASEITAGAIQDYGRGVLVGTTTYGKGSVQNWILLDDDSGAVRVTVARWLTPDRRQIHEVGLEPDVVVELTEEDWEAGRDPQLDAAVEILKGDSP